MDGHRLLVVEDDTALQDAYRQFYTRLGWQVSTAGTVAEALSHLDSGPEPCCLVLDLHLSDGNGVDVLRRVREKEMRTRVVVCTGSVDLTLLKAAAELAPDEMLPKPVYLPVAWSEPCRVCGGIAPKHGRNGDRLPTTTAAG